MTNLEKPSGIQPAENPAEQPSRNVPEAPKLWTPEFEAPSIEAIRRATQGAEREAEDGAERVKAAGAAPEQVEAAQAAGEKRVFGVEQAGQELDTQVLKTKREAVRAGITEAEKAGNEVKVLELEEHIRKLDGAIYRKEKGAEFSQKNQELRTAIKAAEKVGNGSEVLRLEGELRKVERDTAQLKEAAPEKPPRVFDKAQSFDELLGALGTLEGLRGSDNQWYSKEELGGIIDGIRAGRLKPQHLTRAEGLRGKVMELLARERTGRPAEALAETPPPGRVPETPPKELSHKESRNIFQKLTEGSKNLVRNLYERAKFRFVDRARIMFSGALLEHHNKASARLVGRLNEIDGGVQTTEAGLADLNRRMNELKGKYGPLTPDEELKFQKERESHEEKLKAFKKERADATIKIELRNSKKALYETKRDRLCKEANRRISERLKPFEEQMTGLQAVKGKIDDELRAFWEEREPFVAKVKELKARLEDAGFKAERKTLGRLIKEAEANLKASNGYLITRQRERVQIEGRLTRLEEKSSHWREAIQELDRLTGKKPVYHRAPAEPKRVAPRAPEAAQPEAIKKQPQFIPSKYAQAWNKFFGSELPVDAGEFSRDYFHDPAANFSFGALEGSLRRYYSSRAARGKPRLKRQDLEKHLGMLRLFLNK